MIEFRNPSKHYSDGTVAVREPSLMVASHTTVVMVGPSGSGRTTLLRMVNRMVEPTAGQVLIDGGEVRERDAVRLRRSIGYVMQSLGLEKNLARRCPAQLSGGQQQRVGVARTW
ncbi:Choline transport ATP-binding protein OpuBA [Acidipropionibacterium virtanenii]|uniref:Choline transport ATP-binding protein OpuBA n=1 Tax=Acidipropionibacterium virtanenii TaxID=2057246 RepID=A0A344UWU5_9ACTN|nr:Choline transport ATP-binding protein OpuBA [Acidipropionibacterium virtanenii]